MVKLTWIYKKGPVIKPYNVPEYPPEGFIAILIRLLALKWA